MKALKWLGIVAVVTFFLILNAVMLLMSRANQREASVEPLSVRELQRLASKASEEGDDKPIDRPAQEAVTDVDANANDDHGDAASVAHPAQPLRLASRPTREQIVEHINRWDGDKPDLWERKSAVFAVRLHSLLLTPNDKTAPGRIGDAYLRAEDFDSAVPYLREAVRTDPRKQQRRVYCGQLAWLEEDPQLAAELIVRSCQRERDDTFIGIVAYNGIELSVLTHSEELAEYVFQKYRDLYSEMLAYPWSYSPEVRAWLEGRLAREK